VPTIIIGAGEVGSSLAAMLSGEGRDVVVVDVSDDRLQQVLEKGDVQTLKGHGASQQILQQAGVARAKLLVAVTDVDEVNLIAAMTGKQLGVKRTVARVRQEQYLGREGQLLYRNLLGIDMVVSPEIVTAYRLAELAHAPGLLIEGLAHGAFQVLRLPVGPDCPVLEQPLKEVDLPREFILVALERGDEVIIPGGDDALHEGDRATLFVRADQADVPREVLGVPETKPHRAVLVGGGRIGKRVALQLDRAGVEVWLVEADRERANALSEVLADRIRVLHGDGTQLEMLREEGVGTADVFMAVTSRDETNVIACLAGRQLEVPITVALLQRADLGAAVEKFGVTRAVAPRLITASFILKYLRGGHVVSVDRIAGGRAEVLEIVLGSGAPVVGHALSEGLVPDGAIVGAIRRGSELIIPRGDDTLQADDHVIVFALADAVPHVTEKFSP
jgi:trk system potassium uptake protein TrkA